MNFIMPPSGRAGSAFSVKPDTEKHQADSISITDRKTGCVIEGKILSGLFWNISLFPNMAKDVTPKSKVETENGLNL